MQNVTQQPEWLCPECGNNKTSYNLKLIPTGKPIPYPKYIPQIKESCSNCGRYRRFTPQAQNIILRFNDRFASIILPATGRDFYEEGRRA